MNARFLLVIGFFLFGGAVYALHTDKMRVTTSCHDARLYMDGGIDADIESGGLNYHRTVLLYKKSNRKHVLLGSYLVTAETPAHAPVQTFVAGEEAKISIFSNEPVNPHGYPSKFEGKVDGQKVSVSMNCVAKIP